jgi:hypothetical protein
MSWKLRICCRNLLWKRSSVKSRSSIAWADSFKCFCGTSSCVDCAGTFACMARIWVNSNFFVQLTTHILEVSESLYVPIAKPLLIHCEREAFLIHVTPQSCPDFDWQPKVFHKEYNLSISMGTMDIQVMMKRID